MSEPTAVPGPAAPGGSGSMTCLACRDELRADRRGWVCGCGSCLWSLEAVAAEGGQLLVETLVADAKDDAPRGRRCPSCSGQFAVVFLPSGPSRGGRPEWFEQRVDVCIRCWLLWTDSGEMANIGEPLDAAAKPARASEEWDTGPSIKEVLGTEIRVGAGLKEVLSTEIHVPSGLKEVLSTEIHVPSGLKEVLDTEIHVPSAVKEVLATEIRIPRRRRASGAGDSSDAAPEVSGS